MVSVLAGRQLPVWTQRPVEMILSLRSSSFKDSHVPGGRRKLPHSFTQRRDVIASLSLEDSSDCLQNKLEKRLEVGDFILEAKYCPALLCLRCPQMSTSHSAPCA